MIEKKVKTRERIIVVPGDVLTSGKEFLPGEGTRREGNDIIALRFGLLEKSDSLFKVIPLSGAYIPRNGNTVIGQVVDLNFNGWIVDVKAPHLGFLPVADCAGYVNKKDLADYYNIGDTLVCKVKSVRARSTDLTMKDPTCKKLSGGFLMKINPTRVPRVIGKEGSMVSMIKLQTACSIIVGQNGFIWIKGNTAASELLTRDAINLIVKKPFVDGLTDHVKEFLEKQVKK